MNVIELPVLQRDLDGIDNAEALALLYLSNSHEQERVRQRADALNLYLNGDQVSYAISQILNYTNLCENACLHCSLCCPSDSRKAYLLQPEEAIARLRNAPDIIEVCLRGGVHPGLNWDYYLRLVETIHDTFPDLHIEAFSPQEVFNICQVSGLTAFDVLHALRDKGLDSIAGTSADMFDLDVRMVISPGKISAEYWEETIRLAHAQGVPASATILFGSIEKPEHIIDHFSRMRKIQRDTLGFTSFVPLLIAPGEFAMSRMFSLDSVAAWGKVRLLFAVARLYFGRWIPNLEVDWLRFGPDLSSELFLWGANKVCGTLYSERFPVVLDPSAGAGISVSEIRSLIYRTGRVPRQITSLHEWAERSE